MTATDQSAKLLGDDFAWVIVELAPDGILVTGDDGRILVANRHLAAMFGYRREALIGAPSDSLLPPGLRDAHVAHRARYAAAPAARAMGAAELCGCRADGSQFPVEVSLSPAATEGGVVTVVIVRDVTERRALEAAAKVASALDQYERLAADMHDRVIGHLFACGLTLASVLGRNALDDHIAGQLQEILDQLDMSVRAIRETVFAGLGQPQL